MEEVAEVVMMISMVLVMVMILSYILAVVFDCLLQELIVSLCVFIHSSVIPPYIFSIFLKGNSVTNGG